MSYDRAALIDRTIARIHDLEEALSGLVKRLDEIHADPVYKSVWTSYYVHGGRCGPTYVEALAKARAAIEGEAS